MASMENVIKNLFSYAISINDNAFKINDFLKNMTRRYDAATESKDQLIELLKEIKQLFTISINEYNYTICQINKDPICCLTYNKSICNNHCKYLHVCSCIFSSDKSQCSSKELEHNINCKSIKKVLRLKNLNKVDLQALLAFNKHFESKKSIKQNEKIPQLMSQITNMNKIKVQLPANFISIGTTYLLKEIFSHEEMTGGGEISSCEYYPEKSEAEITYKDQSVASRVFKKGKIESIGYNFEITSILKSVNNEATSSVIQSSTFTEHKFIMPFYKHNYFRLIASERNPSWRGRLFKLDKDYRVIASTKNCNIVIIERKSEAKYKAWFKLLNERLTAFLEGFYCETIVYNEHDHDKLKDFIAKIEEVRRHKAIDYHDDSAKFYIVANKNDSDFFYKKYPQFKDAWNKPAKKTNTLNLPKTDVYGFNEMLDKLLVNSKRKFPGLECERSSSTIKLTGCDDDVSKEIMSCIDSVEVKRLAGFNDVRMLQQKNLTKLIEECLKELNETTNFIYKFQVKNAGIYLSYFNKSIGSATKNVFGNVSNFIVSNVKTCDIEFDDQHTIKTKEWKKFEDEHLSELIKNLTCIYTVHKHDKDPKRGCIVLTSTKEYMMPIKLKITNFLEKHECKTKIIVLSKSQYYYLTNVVKDLETVISLFSSKHETKLEYSLNTQASKYSFYNLKLTNSIANNLLLIEKLIKDELENMKTKTFQVESFEKMSNMVFGNDSSQIKQFIENIQEQTYTFITFKRVGSGEQAEHVEKDNNEPVMNGLNSIRSTVQVGAGTLRLEVGSIINTNADVILNSTTKGLELNSGYVSKLILNSAGQTIQAACKQNYPNGIDANTIAVTAAGMLQNIKTIFHMAYLNKFTTHEDCVTAVKTAVINCLEKLIQMGFKSVSIPSLGTGGLAYPPDIVAQTMIKTCCDFMKAAQSKLTINIVLSDVTLIKVFETEFLRSNGKICSDGLKCSNESLRTFNQKPQIKENIEFRIIYKAEADFKSSQKKLNDLIDEKYFSKATIDVDFDEIMIKGEFKNLLKKFKSCYITVANNKIEIKGLKEDVLDVKHQIIDFTHKAMKNTYLNIESHLQLTADIKWQYEWKSGEWKDFSLFNNSLIESAYVKKEKMTMFINDERAESEIWFESMIYISSKHHNCRRLEVKKQGLIEYPKNWTEMNENCDFMLFKLVENTPEYVEVFNDFTSKFQSRIVSIERVQNKTLYEAYNSHKKKLTIKNTNPNELFLFHGTVKNAIDQICQFGFNRSYCGINGVALGHGVYFAVNPATSDGFARPTGNVKRMFRARVLVGESTPGNNSMKVPPMRTNNIPFDSTCDGSKSVFVAYHDNQCYPDYIISYS